jgi:hypothetical protein
MREIIFRCPSTNDTVPTSFKEMAGDATSYETVLCTACAGVHFVNRLTGKTLGADDGDKR